MQIFDFTDHAQYIMKKYLITAAVVLALASCKNDRIQHSEWIDTDRWELSWNDEFDYQNRDELLKVWESDNQSFTHIICSRWEENVEVTGNTVKLVNRKESRGGQDWTSASIWTRQDFQYGYFECRYKYAGASGTNNSFWIMTRGGTPDPTEGKRFEIDINEGHYPNEVNSAIHDGSDPNYQAPHSELICEGSDLSTEYHVVGLEWTEQDLIFYFDGKEIWRHKNEFSFSPAPVRLSEALTKWAGEVTDACDGTFMEVDYVRIYKEKLTK